MTTARRYRGTPQNRLDQDRSSHRVTAYTLTWHSCDSLPAWVLGEAETGRAVATCHFLTHDETAYAKHWARRHLELALGVSVGNWTRSPAGRYIASVTA
jgi:hypothetical protein